MTRILGVLAAALFALGLGACAECSTAPGQCCSMSSGGCKAEGRPMSCGMKATCCCCAKEAAEGAPSQGHQH
ncbi:MAG TPA: hypothetical protein VMU54_05110 [Planctomycetota bacterium]|nr:hypothetical protein [Planctomycetota bacterium]